MRKIILSIAVIAAVVLYVIYGGKTTEQAAATSTTTTGFGSGSIAASSGPKTELVDGSYTGAAMDSYYGNVQVKALVSGGKLTDVQFIQYPNDQHTSKEISDRSMPILRSEAIKLQSAEVDTVSGATQTSDGFKRSLASALLQARQPSSLPTSN